MDTYGRIQRTQIGDVYSRNRVGLVAEMVQEEQLDMLDEHEGKDSVHGLL